MAESKQGRGQKPGVRPDLATILGLVVAVGGIVTGLIFDGGKVQDIIQFNAALIVFGGTLGAVMVTTPGHILLGAARRTIEVVLPKKQTAGVVIDEIIEYASQARKQGILSLETQAQSIQDPFLRKALNLAIDGVEMSAIRDIMEREIEILEHEGESEAKVFEAAGGYAPTIGIIGAVLGLMQVMKHLADIDEVGRGIASAFVATVYGVGIANLLFLPAGNKLRALTKETIHIREAALEGVLSIVEGLNPKLIRQKLEAYDRGSKKKTKAAKSASGVDARSPVSAEG